MSEKEELQEYFNNLTTPKITVEIDQNWVIRASDYHELSFIHSTLKYDVGLNVNFEELGHLEDGLYVGIFWIGERPDEMIKNWRRQYELEDLDD